MCLRWECINSSLRKKPAKPTRNIKQTRRLDNDAREPPYFEMMCDSVSTVIGFLGLGDLPYSLLAGCLH